MLDADRPILSCSDDGFGYLSFAEHIAKCICRMTPDEGIVLAINGPWGSGKTSAINMILENIEKQKNDCEPVTKVIPIKFSPWWFSGQEDLTQVFFTEIAGLLNDSINQNIVDGLKSVGRWLSQYAHIAGIGVQLVTHGVVSADAFAKGVGDADKSASLSESRNELAQNLRKLAGQILVVIDDLDRLPRDEILQILRLVKSVGELPHVVYLLVFDRDVVTKACENDHFGLGGGWLDKIIQASFDLPPIGAESLERYFRSRLQGILGDREPPDVTRWQVTFDEGIRPWLKTPRDVVKLLNAFRVSWNAVRDDVDFADFLALETLRLFAPEVYKLVRMKGKSICEDRNSLVFNSDQQMEVLTELLSLAPIECKTRVTRLLVTVFPVFSPGGQNYTSDGRLYTKYSNQKRACVYKYFPSYFRFSVGDEVLSAADMEVILGQIDDQRAFLDRLREYANIPRPRGGTQAHLLLDQLQISPQNIPQNKITNALSNLIDGYEYFAMKADKDAQHILGFTIVYQFIVLIRSLVARLPAGPGEGRGRLYRDIFLTSTSLLGLTVLLGALRKALGREGGVRSGRLKPGV